MERSAINEALSHLKKGLHLVSKVSDEAGRAELELDLQAVRGLALAAAQGYSASDVEQAYERARFLCYQTGKSAHLFPVLYGLMLFYWCRGNLQSARSIGEEMLNVAVSSDDRELQLIANSSLGSVNLHIGEYEAAMRYLAAAQTEYDRGGTHH